MSHAAWERTKVKPKRGRSIPALVSDAAPGIALQEGEWLDIENSKGKPQLNTYSGYRAIVRATGAICGPVLADFTKASEYAVALAKVTDWPALADHDVSGPVYAKVMRLWHAAVGTKLTAAQKRALTKLEKQVVAQ